MDKNLHELCYMLEDQIDRVVKKGDINPNEMHSIYEAVKTKYYITVMDAMEEAKYDNGYSGRRMSVSYDGRPYYNGYSSYEGEYSGRGRDSMGRFTSRDGGYSSGDDMRAHLEAAMNAAKNEQERQVIRNMMNNM